MTEISALAKGDAIETRLQVEFRQAMRMEIIDRTETCFAGKSTLTKDQFAEDMRLVELMRKKSSW